MDLVTSLRDHAALVAMAVGFAEFAGVPLPSSIVLIGIGAAVADPSMLPLVVVGAVVGAMAGDTLWYHFGRVRGRQLLRFYCKVTLGSSACVSRSERAFGRLGPRVLLFSKLVPGLSTFAAPFTGLSGVSLGRFWLWDGLGALLWASLWVGAGRILGLGSAAAVQARITELGGWIPWVPPGAFLLLIAFRLVRRRIKGPADLDEQATARVVAAEPEAAGGA